jgi:exopolysaccharide biosynthesis WecB/TagA/CpsF family protein
MISIDFLGLRLLVARNAEAADWLLTLAGREAKPPALVCHANCYNLYCYSRQPGLSEALLRRAHMVFEGIAVKAAALILRGAWLPDVNGSDLFPLVMRSAPANLRVFLLGGREDVVVRAQQAIERRWRNVRVVGAETGYFRPAEASCVLARINEAQPDILLLGLGCPYQEQLALAWSEQLQVRVIWTVGGLFDTLSGAKKRAPRWIRRARLEWLYRLAHEPGRLWRRTFVAVPWLALRILHQKMGFIRILHQKMGFR